MQVHAGAAAIRQGGARLTVVYQAEGKHGASAGRAPLELDGRKLRLLVVEDDALIAMDLAVSIDELGGQVAAIAVTAQDAMRLTEELKPDVVLMDVRLRGEPDGIEAAQVIQQRVATPIVFVTGNSDSNTMRRMNALQNTQIILKPVLINELRDAIIRAAGH
jgi:AmiR/NasT family two-component response regulator